MLVWLDIETSGLEEHDRILELAAIVTDDQLLEVGRFQAVTCEASKIDFSKVDEAVMRLHMANGLWQESLLSMFDTSKKPKKYGGYHQDVAYHLREFIFETIGDHTPWVPPQIAGSSVWFDVAFVKRWMPGVTTMLDRHQLDVSAVSELVKRVCPEVFRGRPSSRQIHRAMPDVEDSLELARYYARALWPMTADDIRFPGPYHEVMSHPDAFDAESV